MSKTNIDPRYPIGTYNQPEKIDQEQVAMYIQLLKEFPQLLKDRVDRMSEKKLDNVYREGGWTARQVIHHLADSHMNAYIRCKLAYTEDRPVIKPYFEERWAETVDGKSAPVDLSLTLITAVHNRWTSFLNSLSFTDFSRTFVHPEQNREISIAEMLAIYTWHSEHHLSHIELAAKRK